MPTVARDTLRKLDAPRVLIVGAGGLGCPVAEMLAPHTKVVLSDLDHVDRSNLPRQWLYEASDIGRLKTDVAAVRLPSIETTGAVWLERPDVAGYQLIIECSDNTDLKFAVSDAAIRAGIPVIVGGAVGTTGFALATVPGVTACLRCIFEEPTDDMRKSCRDAGVLSSLPAMVGAVMAGQAARLLAGERSFALWQVDMKTGSSRLQTFQKRCERCCQTKI